MTASRPRQKPLALAYEVAELRAEYRSLLERVPRLAQFEALWDQFAQRLRPLVARLDGEVWLGSAEADEVDDLRLDLMSRQSTALSAYRDPLNMILHTSLRAPSATLYRLFGRVVAVPEEGAVQLQAVSLARFDAQIAEARADIVRERRELDAEIARAGTRLHELTGAVPGLVAAVLRGWLWKDWRRRLATTAAAVVVGALTPPVRAGAAAVWNWIRSLF